MDGLCGEEKQNLEQMASRKDGDPKMYVIVEINITDLI